MCSLDDLASHGLRGVWRWASLQLGTRREDWSCRASASLLFLVLRMSTVQARWPRSHIRRWADKFANGLRYSTRRLLRYGNLTFHWRAVKGLSSHDVIDVDSYCYLT